MTITDKINKSCAEYMRNNLVNANELWLGARERFELEQYITSQSLFNMKDCCLNIKNGVEVIEFMGLKVRFNKWAQSSSFLEVDYNPHYD